MSKIKALWMSFVAMVGAVIFWWSQPIETYDITIDFTRALSPESITITDVKSKREPQVIWDWFAFTDKHYIFLYTHNRRRIVASDKEILYIKKITINKHER